MLESSCYLVISVFYWLRSDYAGTIICTCGVCVCLQACMCVCKWSGNRKAKVPTPLTWGHCRTCTEWPAHGEHPSPRSEPWPTKAHNTDQSPCTHNNSNKRQLTCTNQINHHAPTTPRNNKYAQLSQSPCTHSNTKKQQTRTTQSPCKNLSKLGGGGGGGGKQAEYKVRENCSHEKEEDKI